MAKINRSGNKIIDPQVDLISSLYDNPHGTQTQLASIGRGDSAGFGIVERDPDLAAKDEIIRDKLKRKVARGGTITRDTIEHLVSQPLKSGPVLSRYNRHGELVLDVGIEETEENVAHRVHRAEEMEKEAATIPDLDMHVHEKLAMPLHITDKSRFMNGLVVDGNENDMEEMEKQASDSIPNERPIKEWKFSKETAIPSHACALASFRRLEELNASQNISPADKKKRKVSQDMKLDDVDEHARSKILKLFHASNEFRRHFWAGHPPKTNAAVKKQNAIRNGLEEIKEDMQKFRHELLGASILDIVSLLDPQIEQIICAQKAAETVEKK